MLLLVLSLVLCAGAEDLVIEKREDTLEKRGEDTWVGYNGGEGVSAHWRPLTEAEEKTEDQIHMEIKGLRNLMKKNHAGVFATCKLVLFADMVDFDTADARCKNFSIGTYHRNYGNLATVNEAEKNLHIQLLLRLAYPQPTPKKWGAWVGEQWSWAGLRKIHNNTGASGTAYRTEDWAWFDGTSPGNYHSWMYRMPDQRAMRNGKSGCNESPKCFQNQMRINHAGKWDDTFKYKLHPYTCDYQGRYILSADPSHWDGAKRKCEEAGLVIAKVHTQEQLNEMMVAAEYFLGKRENGSKTWDNDNWFWLGGNDFTVGEGNWTWADGEPLPTDWALPWMHPWRTPNPDNAAFRGNGTENVLAMSKWGQWDDSFGSERRRNFACMCPDVTIDEDEDQWRNSTADFGAL